MLRKNGIFLKQKLRHQHRIAVTQGFNPDALDDFGMAVF
jgi:hypothetical protein